MKDGIRVYVELVEVVTSGPYYDRMARKLAQSPYSHHPLKDCLVFRWHFSCVWLGPTGSLPVGGPLPESDDSSPYLCSSIGRKAQFR